MTEHTLHQQIRAELGRLCTTDQEAFAWLAHAQTLLAGRIPARMIAVGEGPAVLDALKKAAATAPVV